MYAIMLETDYLKKDKFNENFWKAFKDILGSSHVIKTLEKCDFRPIYDHLMAERDQKKALPKEVREGAPLVLHTEPICICPFGVSAGGTK